MLEVGEGGLELALTLERADDAVGGVAHGVRTEGLQYPLTNENLEPGSSRGVSNVLVGSTAGIYGEAGHADYAAAKSAVVGGLLLSLKNEITRVAPLGRVNAVAPGVIDTEMSKTVRELAGDQITSRILLKRIGKPEDIAHPVWFLASRYSDYITGQVLSVDGGFKME